MGSPRTATMTLTLGLAFIAVSCGDETDTTVAAPDPLVGCRSGPTFPLSALADSSQVSITFSVIPLEGDGECPDNPAAAVEVDLGEPFGERRLVDGRDVGVELEDLLPPA